MAPPSVPDTHETARLFSATLADLVTVPDGLRIVIAAADINVPTAVAAGDTVLVRIPHDTLTSPGDVARVAAGAFAAEALHAAPPEKDVSEPLLALADSLVSAGTLALASLPPGLRPVHDWLEAKDVAAALQTYTTGVLDGSIEWQTRRAQMARMARPGGAAPALAQAAAFLLEAFGDAGHAQARPLDVLNAWREGKKPRWPTMPRAVKKALNDPSTAGLSTGDEAARNDEAIAADAAERAVRSRSADPTVATHLPVSLRLLAAAQDRARDAARACAWLEGAVIPPGLRTGCRDSGEGGGVVYSRPRPDGGSDIVSRSAAGDEAPLVVWPRWVLFPRVAPDGTTLDFIDPLGVWSIDLSGSTPPVNVLPGHYRRLAVSPTGTTLATLSWPAATVVLRNDDRVRATETSGGGGITWIADDVLMASDGAGLALVSSSGERRPWPKSLPCASSLTTVLGAVVATTSTPCSTALVRMTLGDASTSDLLALPDGALGVVAQSGGALVFGAAGEIWLWNGGPQARRVGGGITPGPG